MTNLSLKLAMSTETVGWLFSVTSWLAMPRGYFVEVAKSMTQ